MNYLSAENYQALNEKLTQSYSEKYGSSLKVRAFENMMLAGYDLCFGLLQFLSHKPKIGIIRSGTSLQEYLLPHFYRLQTPVTFKKENENSLQFISQFDHECNFVTWSAENEITGEIFLNYEKRLELHKGLSAKRIFSIEVKAYFNSEDVEILKQNPYAIIIETGTLFSKQSCLVFHSDKLKTPSLIGHYQNNLQSFQDNVLPVRMNSLSVNPAPAVILQSAEQSLLNFFNRYAVKPDTLQDRLVLCSKTVAGTALREHLNLSLNQAFTPSDLPSWITETISAWWPEAKSSELMMGLVVIDLKSVGEISMQEIIKIHENLTSQSSWSIS